MTTLDPVLRPEMLPDVVRTPTSLDLPDDMTFEEWRDIGLPLLSFGQSIMWWVGDWLRYGERAYGHLFTAAAEWTGLEYSTLANALWVTKRVAADRRRPALSFSHHAEVAALEPSDQDRLLEQAEVEEWPRRQLRVEVRRLSRETADHDDGLVRETADHDDGLVTATIRVKVGEGDARYVDDLVARVAGDLTTALVAAAVKAEVSIDRARR